MFVSFPIKRNNIVLACNTAKESMDCQHSHILFNLKGIGNQFFACATFGIGSVAAWKRYSNQAGAFAIRGPIGGHHGNPRTPQGVSGVGTLHWAPYKADSLSDGSYFVTYGARGIELCEAWDP